MGIIFISHSSHDNARATEVRDWLRGNGWGDTFLDLDPALGLAPGQRWQAELKKAGERCSAVIVLISPGWLGSKWCQVEFLLASQLGKQIFGVLIAPLLLADLPLELTAHYQLVDISDPATRSEGLDRLRWGLRRAGLDPGDFAWPPKDEPLRSPYRGLRTLEEKDAGVFFGREAPITRGLDTLRRMRDGAPERLLVVLGASGAGKSSFLRAGLLARLRRDEEHFLVLPTVRPARGALTGSDGLLHAFGLVEATDRDALRRRLAEVRAPVVDRLERFATAARETHGVKPPTLVLSIDQAEELFGSDSPESPAFFDLLREALDIDGNLVVVLTIRSDSYAGLQTEPRIADVPRLLVDLPPLSPASFKQVIEGPGRLAQPPLVFEPGLTDRLLTDLDQADALPLLAFTLERLVAEYGADCRLELVDYERGLGGLGGAIDKAVEVAFAAASSDGSLPRDRTTLESLARRAFIPWLVKVDDVEGVPKRRVASMQALPDDTHGLVRHFVNQRLLVSDTVGAEDVLEISHESVFRHWKSLSGWIDEERASLLALDAVRRAASEWCRTGGESASEGWLIHRAGRLIEAEALLQRPDYARLLTEEGRAYLAACRRLDDAERREAEARLRREQEQLRRQRRLQRRAAVALALVGLVTAVFGYFTAVQSRAASRETSLVLTDYAKRAVALGNYERATRFAALAAREGPLTVADPGAAPTLVSAAGRSSLLVSLSGHRKEASWKESADGRRWLSWSEDGTVRVWDAISGNEIARQTHRGGVGGAILAADGGRVLSWSPADETVRVWDARSGREIARQRHERGVIGAAFTADGGRVLSWGGEIVRLWDATSGREIAHQKHQFGVDGAVLAADGGRVLSWGSDEFARVWDATSGREIARQEHSGEIRGAVFAPDGQRVLSWSEDGTARVWDATSGREIARQPHPLGEFSDAVFVRGGTQVLSWGVTASASLWDARSGREVARLEPERGLIDAVVAADGERALTWDGNGIVRVWDAPAGREIARQTHSGGFVEGVFSADVGRVLSWGGRDGIVRVWDATTGREIARQTHRGGVVRAVFAADGRRVLSWGYDGTVRTWDAASGGELANQHHEHRVVGAVFTGDGQRVLSWDADGGARVWLARTDTETARQRHDGPVTGARFDGVGGRVLSWDSSAVRVWDTRSGSEIARQTHAGEANGARFDADDKRVLSWGFDGIVRVWDAASGRELARHAHDDRVVIGALFASDGRRVLSWGADRTARVWDASSGREISRQSQEAWVRGADFAPDGQRVLSWTDDGTVSVWDAKTGSEISHQKHDGERVAAVFAPDGQRVLSWGDDGTARVWDARSGRQLTRHTLNPTGSGWVRGAVFAPDGERVLSWGNDDSARVWDARSGREITRHQGRVDGAAFAVDGRRVLSWGGSSVHVWDATSGRDIARQTLEEYTYGSVFAPDGRRVLSWSSDGTSRVWDSTSGSEMAQHAHGGSVRGGLFSRDGGRVLSWSNDGTARVWDVRWSIARASNRSLIAEVCDRKLRESVAPASSAQPDGGTLPDASIRRITPLDAAAAPMLSGRVGEDVCRSSDWLSETAEWLTRAVMGPRN